MARRLVLIPVLPRVMVSEALNFLGSAGRARAQLVNAVAWRESAPAAYVARWRNSRRFIEPPSYGVPRALLISHGRTKRDCVIRPVRAPDEELRNRGNVRPRPICHSWRAGTRHARRGQ